MNPLLLLEDRVSILTERCGLVIVKRDVPFRNIKIDLGFQHRLVGDHNDETFYSIPILDFSKSSKSSVCRGFDEAEQKDFCSELRNEEPEQVKRAISEQCATDALMRSRYGVKGTQRFLIRYSGNVQLVLAEASPPEYAAQIQKTPGYWHAETSSLDGVPDFKYQLAKAERELQKIEEAE